TIGFDVFCPLRLRALPCQRAKSKQAGFSWRDLSGIVEPRPAAHALLRAVLRTTPRVCRIARRAKVGESVGDSGCILPWNCIGDIALVSSPKSHLWRLGFFVKYGRS